MPATRLVLCGLVAAAIVSAAPAAAQFSGPAAPAVWSTGYCFVLLRPGTDLHAARRLVQQEGGAVALVLPPRALTGWIPPGRDAALVGRAGIERIVRSAAEPPIAADGATQSAWRFYARAARGELDQAMLGEAAGPNPATAPGPAAPEVWLPDARSPGDISELDVLANLRRSGSWMPKTGGTSITATSESMTGTVAVSLFFVESNGSGVDPNQFTWTPSAEQAIYDEAAAGLSWWASKALQHSNCWVSFQLNAYFATQDARLAQWREPVLHPSTDFAYVVQSVLGNFGYTAGNHLARVTAFNQIQRSVQGTDWAYSAFVACNPTGAKSFTDGYAAWAYLGGPYTALLQRSFSWPFRQVFAHESAHIFRACDEYSVPGYGGCNGCTECADTGVANGNCEDCNPNPVACMMRTNAWSLCNWTAGQIGWWNTPCVDHTPPAPYLDHVEPAAVPQGIQDTVEIHGAFFTPGSMVSFGGGVQIQSVEFVTSSLMRVVARVDLETAPGPRDVIVTAPDLRATRLTDGFQVRRTPVHYVSSLGSSEPPYDTPATAAVSLAEVLQACSLGDTVALAGGVYAPFEITKTLHLVGGWTDDFQMRLPQTRPSIVEGGAASAVVLSGLSNAATLDGLTLRGGAGTSLAIPDLGNVRAGGAVLCTDARPTLRNCTLENGATEGPGGAGGGGFFWRSRPVLEGCTVRGNLAARGGGLFFLDSDAVLRDNDLDGNSTDSGGLGAGLAVLRGSLDASGGHLRNGRGARRGGGAHLESCTSATLQGMSIASNIVSEDGGGVWSTATPLDLVACEVRDNSCATRGGGVYASGARLVLESSLVARNQAAVLGGGLYLAGSVPLFDNVTLAGNDGGPASGAFFSGASTVGRIRGSVVARNVLGGLALGDGVAPALDYNVYGSNGGFDLSSLVQGPNDISGDPRFADPVSDYHPGLHSPCIDSGDPARADVDGSRNDRGAYGGPRAERSSPPRVVGARAVRSVGQVLLAWDPVVVPDVAAYAVYRSATASAPPAAADFLATVAVPATQYTDPEPPLGAWYFVAAVNGAGHAGGYSEAASPVATTDAELHTRPLALHPLAPNPAKPGTWVAFDLPQSAGVTLAVYTAKGQRVRHLLAGNPTAGRHRLYWDGRDDAGRPVASGAYWVQLEVAGEQRSRRVVLVR